MEQVSIPYGTNHILVSLHGSAMAVGCVLSSFSHHLLKNSRSLFVDCLSDIWLFLHHTCHLQLTTVNARLLYFLITPCQCKQHHLAPAKTLAQTQFEDLAITWQFSEMRLSSDLATGVRRLWLVGQIWYVAIFVRSMS